MKTILTWTAILFALAVLVAQAQVSRPADSVTPPEPSAAPAPGRTYADPTDAANPADAAGVRFKWVDIFLDTGAESLAAYQFEFTAESGKFSVVGIEGGDAAAFKVPPYYDPAAMSHNRVILAAFSTGNDLPAGRVRVARIHVEIPAASHPQYVARLQAAANAAGKSITASISFTEGAAP